MRFWLRLCCGLDLPGTLHAGRSSELNFRLEALKADEIAAKVVVPAGSGAATASTSIEVRLGQRTSLQYISIAIGTDVPFATDSKDGIMNHRSANIRGCGLFETSGPLG